MWSHTLLKNSIQYTTLNLNVDSLLLVALSTTGICSKKKKKKKKRNLLYNCVILESPAVPANWLTVIQSSSGLGKGSLPQ